MELYGMSKEKVQSLKLMSYGFAIETKIAYGKERYKKLCNELKSAYETKSYDIVSKLNNDIIKLNKALNFNELLLIEMGYEI